MSDAAGRRESQSGLDFKLHPLVLLTISDHHTRIKANAPAGQDAASSSTWPAAPARVLGYLLGQQNGRLVDISNSFELNYTTDAAGALQIDAPLLTTKLEQYKQVFPNLDVVGWYTTGSEIAEADMQIHRKVMELNESPVLLLFNTRIDALRKDLPILLYESELHVVDERPTFIFVQSRFSIETSEAERIGVNQVAKVHPTGNPSGTEQLTVRLTATESGVKMLIGRISILLQLLQRMHSAAGALPYDHSLVRETKGLLRRLPAINTAEFQQDFLAEYNDAMLTVFMSSLTKGVQGINEIVDKHTIAYERSSRRRGMG
eukprot:jgi/Astpho2/5404/e_gw1.00076.27.1_t